MPKVGKDPQAPQVTADISEQFRINMAFEDRQEEILVVLVKKRVLDAKSRSLLERANLAFARAEEELTRVYQRKTYEITQDPNWESAAVDPREGVKTAGWSEIVIEHLVAEDAEWLAAKKTYYEAQELASKARQDAMLAQAEVASLNDELGALKNRAIYRAALLYASVPINISMGEASNVQPGLESV
jgi:hypothetical protein